MGGLAGSGRGGRVRPANSPRRGGCRRLLLCCLDQAMNAARSNPSPRVLSRLRPLARYAWLTGAALVVLLWVRPLHADGLEGRFEVRSADLQIKDGVYHLNAHLDLPVGDAVRRGLAEGVPLTMQVDLDIERVRHLLPN